MLYAFSIHFQADFVLHYVTWYTIFLLPIKECTDSSKLNTKFLNIFAFSQILIVNQYRIYQETCMFMGICLGKLFQRWNQAIDPSACSN